MLLESFMNYLSQGRFENLTQKQNPILILAKIIQTMNASHRKKIKIFQVGLIRFEICLNLCKVFKYIWCVIESLEHYLIDYLS